MCRSIRRVRISIVLISVLACTDFPTALEPGPGPRVAERFAPEMIVSGPIQAESGDHEEVSWSAYVSARPGSLPDVMTARLWSSNAHSSVENVAVVDGGFDPIPITALVGDTIRLSVTNAAGAVSRLFNIVQMRGPSIVRTVPAPDQKNVPLDSRIVVVFSEPISEKLHVHDVELRIGNGVVETGMKLARERLELSPAVPLESATVYGIHISSAITNSFGQQLEADFTSAFTTVKTPVGPSPPDLDRLVGRWQAEKWEFFSNSNFNGLLDEMIAGGLTGTLSIEWRDPTSFHWEWRETYRWWGPQFPTIVRGWATVQSSVIDATVDAYESQFECDWGDCDGPLHGEHRFNFVDEDKLVITRSAPVNYYHVTGPSAAYSRITLTKLP